MRRIAFLTSIIILLTNLLIVLKGSITYFLSSAQENPAAVQEGLVPGGEAMQRVAPSSIEAVPRLAVSVVKAGMETGHGDSTD